MSNDKGSLLELEEGGSDVDLGHVDVGHATRKPRALVMIIGVAVVLLCCVTRSSGLQAARVGAAVGLAKKPPFSDPGIKLSNPEEDYSFGEELHRDEIGITKVVTKKDTGDQYIAEMYIFDSDSKKFIEGLYHLRSKTLAGVKGVPEVIEAYMVQHNLIIISPYLETKPALEWMAAKTPITEGDAAKLMVSIMQALVEFQATGFVHGNINPLSVGVSESGDIVFLNLQSAIRPGQVIRHFGETEYVAPEALSIDKVQPNTDVWSLATVAYTLLSGVSPFYNPDEDEMVASINKARLPEGAMSKLQEAGVSENAMQAFKKGTSRAPENRPGVEEYLELWQACESENTELNIKGQLLETNTRLLDELNAEAIHACGAFKTFDEDEVECEVENDDDDDDDDWGDDD